MLCDPLLFMDATLTRHESKVCILYAQLRAVMGASHAEHPKRDSDGHYKKIQKLIGGNYFQKNHRIS